MYLDISTFSPKKQGILKGNIEICFNKDIDKSTILQSIILIEDPKRSISSIKDLYNGVKTVATDIMYDEKKILIYPRGINHKNKYVLIVKPSIKSIDGYTLRTELVVPFYVEEKKEKPVITYPSSDTIVQSIERIDLFSLSENTRIQISDSESFSNLLINDNIIGVNSYILDNPITISGNYYIKLISNGLESETISVYVDTYAKSVESTDIDYPFVDIDNYDDLKVCVTPSIEKRIYSSYGKFLLRLNRAIDVDLDDLVLFKIYDHKTDKEIYEEIDIKSISYTSDNMYTYIVVDLGVM